MISSHSTHNSTHIVEYISRMSQRPLAVNLLILISVMSTGVHCVYVYASFSLSVRQLDNRSRCRHLISSCYGEKLGWICE